MSFAWHYLPPAQLAAACPHLPHPFQVTKLLTGDFSEQRAAAQGVLLEAFKGAPTGGQPGLLPRRQPPRPPSACISPGPRQRCPTMCRRGAGPPAIRECLRSNVRCAGEGVDDDVERGVVRVAPAPSKQEMHEVAAGVEDKPAEVRKRLQLLSAAATSRRVLHNSRRQAQPQTREPQRPTSASPALFRPRQGLTPSGADRWPPPHTCQGAGCRSQY